MYVAIYEDLSARIAAGELAAEARLPSEHAIAEQFGVSRMTVRQALDKLVDEGVLLRRRGAGTFVGSERTRYRRQNRLASFGAEIGADDELETQVLQIRAVVPDDQVREELQLRAGAQAVEVRRLRRLPGGPVSLQTSWVPYALASSLPRHGLVGGSLYRTLREEHQVELRWAEQAVSASAADEEAARLLEVPLHAPLLEIRRTAHVETNAPAEYARSLTRPEFPLWMRLQA